MAKRESNIVNMVLTLFIVTLVASAILGYVHQITEEPIRLAKEKNIQTKIGVVVPEFDNNPVEEAYTITSTDGLGELTFYPAKKGGVLIGTAIETFTKSGFSGEFKLMVGLLPDGTIHEIAVLEHKETPGLGDKMEIAKDDFHEQFQQKNPASFKLVVTKDGGDVDAITASTISSRAYCDAVQRAFDTYMKGGKK